MFARWQADVAQAALEGELVEAFCDNGIHVFCPNGPVLPEVEVDLAIWWKGTLVSCVQAPVGAYQWDFR
jgi:hypothetical protein